MKRLFDFECDTCTLVKEKLISDDILELQCDSCSGSMKRVISPTKSFEFKGSGFYETDFKGK